MDQIFERLERLVKAWTNSGAAPSAGRGWGGSGASRGDSDLDAAMAELDDFLDTSKTETERRESEERRRAEERRAQEARARTRDGGYRTQGTQEPSTKSVVEDAYRYLGLPPYAAFADVKTAYKKLLFKHHPDRNSGTPDQMKRATETSSRINAAYQIIEAYEESRAPR